MAELKNLTLHNQPYHPLFDENSEAWHLLAPSIRRKSYDRDEILVRHGDAAHSLWLVHDGWIKLSRQTPDGKETIIGLCTHGDIFGEAALFPNASYPYEAEIIGTTADISIIPALSIQAINKNDATFSGTLMTLLNERISQTQLRLEHASTMSTTQRLGCFLLRLCRPNANGTATLQIPIEKHILAGYLGMKPETLSRSQQQLKSIGVNIIGPKVTVENTPRLKDFVCGSCSESGTCLQEQDDEE